MPVKPWTMTLVFLSTKTLAVDDMARVCWDRRDSTPRVLEANIPAGSLWVHGWAIVGLPGGEKVGLVLRGVLEGGGGSTSVS